MCCLPAIHTSRVSSRQTRNFGFGQSSQSQLRLRQRPQKPAGALRALSSKGSRKGTFFAPAFPAPLESPGLAVRGEPVRRDDRPLDSHLFPSHPCAWPGRVEFFPRPFRPNFAFFASLSCIARKTGVRRPWRTRSPGRRFTGSPPIIRLAHRRWARRKAPKKYQHLKTAFRLHSGLGLTKGRRT